MSVTSNCLSVFYRFGDIGGFVRPEPILLYPTPLPGKIWGVSLRVDV